MALRILQNKVGRIIDRVSALSPIVFSGRVFAWQEFPCVTDDNRLTLADALRVGQNDFRQILYAGSSNWRNPEQDPPSSLERFFKASNEIRERFADLQHAFDLDQNSARGVLLFRSGRGPLLDRSFGDDELRAMPRSFDFSAETNPQAEELVRALREAGEVIAMLPCSWPKLFGDDLPHSKDLEPVTTATMAVIGLVNREILPRRHATKWSGWKYMPIPEGRETLLNVTLTKFSEQDRSSTDFGRLHCELKDTWGAMLLLLDYLAGLLDGDIERATEQVASEVSAVDASTADQLAEKFNCFADNLASSSAQFLTAESTHRIGAAIYHAWLHDLIKSASAIQKTITWVVENPPPAETRKQKRSQSFNARPLRSQQEMMKGEICTAVFNLLHSTGEIEKGRIGGIQLCHRLASIVLDSKPKAESLVPSKRKNASTYTADDHAVWDWILLIALHPVIDKLATDFSEADSIALDYRGRSSLAQRAGIEPTPSAEFAIAETRRIQDDIWRAKLLIKSLTDPGLSGSTSVHLAEAHSEIAQADIPAEMTLYQGDPDSAISICVEALYRVWAQCGRDLRRSAAEISTSADRMFPDGITTKRVREVWSCNPFKYKGLTIMPTLDLDNWLSEKKIAVFSKQSIGAEKHTLNSRMGAAGACNSSELPRCFMTYGETMPAIGSSTIESKKKLIAVLTEGVADERINQAAKVLGDSQFSANEKLERIDSLIPLPPTSSSAELGKMLGVSKQAIQKTDWWQNHRAGQQEELVNRRQDVHRQRSDQAGFPNPHE